MDQTTTIRAYMVEDYDKVKQFLDSITALKSVEEELFKNSIIIETDDKVVGMISYEKFRGRALIRYFIFDNDVDEENIVAMYECFFSKLKSENIKAIYAIISKGIIVDMFLDLGFMPFPKEEFFLTEKNIMQTKYHASDVMVYHID